MLDQMLITAISLQEDALAEATAAGEEDETIPELGLDKKKKKKKKREVNCQAILQLHIQQASIVFHDVHRA